MAGGSGTRLWPRSRKDRPKQFHSLTSDRSLLQETVARLDPAIDSEHIYIIANKTHVRPIKEQLEWLDDSHIIAEPVAKNTAPAVGIMAVTLYEKDPDAVMLVLPADHFIAKGEDFRRLLGLAESIIREDDFLLTLGIKPTYPETGYGYIEIASEYKEVGDDGIFWVKSFKEKPDAQTAQKYVTSWRYVWNSGMFIWKASAILDRFKKYAPEIYEGLERYRKAIGTPKEAEELAKVYKSFPNISIDYAILEKSERVLVIPADIGWSDIGSWQALYELLSFDQQTNVVAGRHVGIDTYNCLIHGGSKLIATIGLDNLVIVDTDDVLLIMPRGRSQDIKKLLDKLQKTGKTEYL
ncbi:MAG TPA: mannose-1-phosphate guanylyltransferase [Armatimonadota bacterium]|nr:mannose-1-phosphate guanylyltransferase [Armatimonadota bacterium]HOP79328.1 mannose-1-phosphate guanylyltransferase [Armatimonadota bacterium]HPP73501.1 mannose-1-phosphate guanylyltransferase [Armatimonadota bacterium]